MTDEKRTARKAAMQQMYAELRDEKTEMISQKEEYDRELETLSDMDPMKNVVRNRIRVIEEKLTTDYYQAVEARGDSIPAAMAPTKPRVTYTKIKENIAPNRGVLESQEAKAKREIKEIADMVNKRHLEEEAAALKAQIALR